MNPNKKPKPKIQKVLDEFAREQTKDRHYGKKNNWNELCDDLHGEGFYPGEMVYLATLAYEQGKLNLGKGLLDYLEEWENPDMTMHTDNIRSWLKSQLKEKVKE